MSASGPDGSPFRLHGGVSGDTAPHGRHTAVANTVPGLAAAVLGAIVAADSPNVLAKVSALVWWLAGIAVAIRGFRMAVGSRSPEVKVRGLFWTRTLPRGAVREVTSSPALLLEGLEGTRPLDPPGRVLRFARDFGRIHSTPRRVPPTAQAALVSTVAGTPGRSIWRSARSGWRKDQSGLAGGPSRGAVRVVHESSTGSVWSNRDEGTRLALT